MTAALLCTGTGCNTVGADSDTVTVWLNQLRVTMELSERAVAPGDELTVTIRLHNRSNQPLQLVTAKPVIAGYYVKQDDDIIPFEGTLLMLPGLIGNFEIGGSETLTFTHPITARLQQTDPETGEPVPAQAGWYTLLAVPTIISINGEPGHLPELAQTFRVR
ncbi:hypothetical protein [Cyclonatronum proteinivorum]|nr:hypothetical protein [Cyclonatronum proteinivorum]